MSNSCTLRCHIFCKCEGFSTFLAYWHISYGSFDCIVVASMLVLERVEVEVIVEKMSVQELMEALLVDDVVLKKVEVGVVNTEAVVFEELVVDTVEVGVTDVVGVVVGEDINLTGPLSLRSFLQG